MSTDESATPPAPEALDGENERDRVGIMASEKTWIVPPWVKAATFWIMVLTIGGIGFFEAQKRATFRGLLVDSVVEPEPWGNAVAPEVSLPVLYEAGKDGDRSARSLSSMRGRWVFLNFWATWCPPCRDEMPSMEMLQRRFGADNFSIVTVSVDESESEIARFFGAEKPTFQVLWDRQKTFSTQYGSTKFPETYLIDPEGRIAAKFTGPRDWYNQGTVQYFDDIIRGRRPPIRS